MSDDTFDPNKFRLTPEAEPAIAEAQAIPVRRVPFVPGKRKHRTLPHIRASR